jgi:hypothetical protein
MKLQQNIKLIALNSVCFLYILLFVYAALNKLLDFQNFQIQLAQSPLISAFAAAVSYTVPTIEILIALMLCFERTRKIALYSGFCLMVMFTAYIIIMINFSPFVPCSCGGILEKMSWNEHLIFNIAFVSLGFFGLLQTPQNAERPNLKIPTALMAALIGSSVMVLLFLTSEDMMHHRNSFIRRFPHHPVSIAKTLNLKFNSYYIAGDGDGKVYLGNSTAPLSVTVVDSTLSTKERHIIKLFPIRDQFYSLQLAVRLPYFYLYDGKIPIVYRGVVGEWTAKVWTAGNAYFNAFEPMDNEKAAFRAISSSNHEHILGLFDVADKTTVNFNALLDKQTDGIFDTGGILSYNVLNKKILYTYSYKNEYLVIDANLQSKIVRHTIDTTTHVRIKTQVLENTKQRKLSSPAWTVNNLSRTYGDYLFINSALMGKFEPEEMWDKASVIDIYDINEGTYEYSFYLLNVMGFKVSDFIVGSDKGYAICGQYLASYRLRDNFYAKRNTLAAKTGP